jgi:hypothetical protein
MNVALIILIIVILVFALYIVYYVGFTSQSLIDLNKSTTTIANKDITNPTSTSFAYSMWVYVNNWSSGDKNIVIAKDTDSTSNPLSTINFRVYLDSTTPTLKTDIYTTDPVATKKTKTITITNNFPVQRWVYIVVSVEGSVVDCYLDGKLVKSQQFNYLPDMKATYSISYGMFDAFLTRFSRISTPRDPQSVWTSYMAGNGFSAQYGPGYGFSFVLTKDQTPLAKYEYK